MTTDNILTRLVTVLRLKRGLEYGLNVASVLVLLLVLGAIAPQLLRFASMSPLPPLLVALLLALLLFGYRFIRQYRQINLPAVLHQLNQQYDTLEHSSQLLLQAPQQLALLPRLQQQKMATRLQALAQQGTLWQNLPNIRLQFSLGVLGLAIVLQWSGLIIRIDTSEAARGDDQTAQPSVQPANPAVTLVALQVTVEPPAYTQQAVTVFDQGDIELIEGSTVTWQARFSDRQQHYQLLLANGVALPLVETAVDGEAVFSGQLVINKTGLYQLAWGDGEKLPAVYGMAVTLDQRPSARVITPAAAVVTIAKEGDPKWLSEAIVSDDFAISEVKILASVAKGSGEAVKFRDEEFRFDRQTHTEQGDIYRKDWNLQALGMAPGDELYFTVVAFDNKPNQPQQGRSSTVIVRWLDEQATGINADGVLLDVEAEYFRSQRQIIIETEQLISDKNELSKSQFEALSVALGQAQSDLKTRYGQYLGDEVGEGPGEQLTMSDGGDHDHDHDEPAMHTSMAEQAAQVVAQFAHTHESVDIGEVSPKNPKAMMKKAVSIMWQAELHLMMSEPALALPYEQQAYKYLKLALAAERIYVKRLGFVPPPVKEEARLTGKLEDIHSYQQHRPKPTELSHDDLLFRQSIALLQHYQWWADHPFRPTENDRDRQWITPFTPPQLANLARLQQRLTDLAESREVDRRGTLIKQAATVQRLLASVADVTTSPVGPDGAAEDTALVNPHLVNELQQKLWQLISHGQGQPATGQALYLEGHPALLDYARQQQLLVSPVPDAEVSP